MPRPSLLHPPPEQRAFVNALRAKFQRPPLPPPPAPVSIPKPTNPTQMWLGHSLTTPNSKK
jgi:hypothetical protein